MIENPLTPVYVGGCQGGCLGTPIAIFPHSLPDGSAGAAVEHGTAGDLVSPGAFPNVPIYLWNDTKPAPGAKYTSAYFSRFKDVWAQGDFAVVHPVTRNIYMLGRSDGVLNPSGIRFGSADIYAVLEKWFAAEIAESLCVGQRRPQDSDERVFLFVLMRQGKAFDKSLVEKIRKAIANDLTKRHVPKFIFEVSEIPVSLHILDTLPSKTHQSRPP